MGKKVEAMLPVKLAERLEAYAQDVWVPKGMALEGIVRAFFEDEGIRKGKV